MRKSSCQIWESKHQISIVEQRRKDEELSRVADNEPSIESAR